MKNEQTAVKTVKLQIIDADHAGMAPQSQENALRENMEDTKNREIEDAQCRYLESLPAFLDVRRFAKEIGVSEPTAYKFIQSKKVRFFRVGTQIRIPREAMVELAMGCTKDGEIHEEMLSKYDL